MQGGVSMTQILLLTIVLQSCSSLKERVNL